MNTSISPAETQAPFENIAIIGCGQIGGSLLFSILEKDPTAKIIAYDIAPDIQEKFFESPEFKRLESDGTLSRKSVLDRVTFTNNSSKIAGCDLAVIATPVSEAGAAIQAIAPYINSQTVITDVCSTKGKAIARINRELAQNSNDKKGWIPSYVPFHILNGTAGTGIATSQAGMFKAPGVIVPNGIDPACENRVKSFWESHGSTIHYMSADQHDKVLGTISHLEHAIMFSLIKTNFMEDALNSICYADPGSWLQAGLRITNLTPGMWVPIFIDNKENIVESAKHFRENLTENEVLLCLDESLRNPIKNAHEFAKDKPSARITPFSLEDYDGQYTGASAFAGFLSLSIAENAKRIEESIGIPLASIANPSFKDGLGPIAIDPDNVSKLLERAMFGFGRLQQLPLLKDFLKQFDRTIAMIERGDKEEILAFVKDVKQRSAGLETAFAPPPKARTAPTPQKVLHQ